MERFPDETTNEDAVTDENSNLKVVKIQFLNAMIVLKLTKYL